MSKQEEIKQALAAATPGPWIANDDSVKAGETWICQMYEGELDCECDFNEFQNAERNAGFIAMAPEYIAYLLEENERLRKELEEERKKSAAVRKAMQDVMYYLQRDSLIPAQDILEQYLAMSAGQEGEGNQDE